MEKINFICILNLKLNYTDEIKGRNLLINNEVV